MRLWKAPRVVGFTLWKSIETALDHVLVLQFGPAITLTGEAKMSKAAGAQMKAPPSTSHHMLPSKCHPLPAAESSLYAIGAD